MSLFGGLVSEVERALTCTEMSLCKPVSQMSPPFAGLFVSLLLRTGIRPRYLFFLRLRLRLGFFL